MSHGYLSRCNRLSTDIENDKRSIHFLMAFAAIIAAFTPGQDRYMQQYNGRRRGRPSLPWRAIMKVFDIIGKVYKKVVPPIRFLRRYLLVTFGYYRYNFRKIVIQSSRPTFTRMPSTSPKAEAKKPETSPDKSAAVSHQAPQPLQSAMRPNSLHFILSQHALFASLIQHLHYHEVLSLLSITPYTYSLLRGPNALPLSTLKMHSCIPETRKSCWCCQAQICTDWERTITKFQKPSGCPQPRMEISGGPPVYKSRLDPGHPTDPKPFSSSWTSRLRNPDPALTHTTNTKTISENGCRLAIIAANPPSQYHLQHCRPVCTRCFYQTVCHRRRARAVYPLQGGTITGMVCKCVQPRYGPHTRRTMESRDVCKSCHRDPDAAGQRHDAPFKAQLYEAGEGLFAGECTDCGLKFDRRRSWFGRVGRGIRWWRCEYCGGECRTDVHRRWRGWFEGFKKGDGKGGEDGQREAGTEMRERV